MGFKKSQAIYRLTDTSCFYLMFDRMISHVFRCFPRNIHETLSNHALASYEKMLTSDISNTSGSLNKDLGSCWGGISLWNPQLQSCAYLGAKVVATIGKHSFSGLRIHTMVQPNDKLSVIIKDSSIIIPDESMILILRQLSFLDWKQAVTRDRNKWNEFFLSRT